jgi:hypothetical protein
MKHFNQIAAHNLINSNDLPSASPVITYYLAQPETEEIETRIASRLQSLIRTLKSERNERSEIIQQIIVECCKELDQMRSGSV